MGPVNWTPRFDARFLDAKGLREFLRYLELNPIRAGLAQEGRPWPWSSARAHSLGHDPDDLLTFDLWRHIFGNPDTILADWLTYVNGPLNEVRANAVRLSLHTGSRVNRPTGWASSPSPPAD